MKLADLMTKKIYTCAPTDSLQRAAQLMWEHDCGVLPVVDAEGRAIAMVTDRDALMAAYTQGKALSAIPVSTAATRELVALRPDDTIEAAEWIMGTKQLRRIPIVDEAGRPVGIVSLGDLARRTHSRGDGMSALPIGWTLAAITRPRNVTPTYRVVSVEGAWVVFDADDVCVSERMPTPSDAVVHAKELARRDDGAFVVVEKNGAIVSEFFHQRGERASLEGDDSTPSFAATRFVHLQRPPM